jgi:hypothetical protein
MVQRIWQRVPARPGDMVGYVLSALALAYLHYFGLLLVCLQAVAAGVALLWRPAAWRVVTLTYGFVLLGYVPWIREMLADAGITSFWIPTLESFDRELARFLLFLFNGSAGLLAAVMVVTAIGFLTLWRRDRRSRDGQTVLSVSTTLCLVLWILAPFTVAYVRSVGAAPVLKDRYLLISFPAACLLVARGLLGLPLRLLPRTLVSAGLLASFVVHLLWPRPFYSVPRKPQYREAVSAIREQNDVYPESVIVTNGILGRHLNYYFRLPDSTGQVDGGVPYDPDLPRLAKLRRRQPSHVWFVNLTARTPQWFTDYMNAHYRLIEHRLFYEVDLWLWQDPSVAEL